MLQQPPPPPKMRPETPEHKGLAIGGYEEKRRKLLEERKKEYNDMLAKVCGLPSCTTIFLA